MSIKKIKTTSTGENVKDVWDESNIKLTQIEKDELENIDNKKKIKFLVDQYKQAQDYRITTENQARSLMQGYDDAVDAEHPTFIQRSLQAAAAQEQLYKKYLDIVTDNIPICKWMKSIKGIGPVFAATLYASFDVSKGSYATDFLSYAGLNDNNNPWLGADKAKALVNKIESEFVPLANKAKDNFENWILSEFPGKSGVGILKTFNSKIKTYAKKNPNMNLKEVEKLLQDICETKGITNVSIPTDGSIDIDILPDALVRIVYPTHVGMYHYNHAHMITRRKVANIKRGTEVCAIGKKKGAEQIDPNTVNCTLVNLQNYLAKPPYNSDLKKVMYLLGEAFMKVSNRGSLYGQIYSTRKAEELAKNEKGEYAAQAAALLASKNYDKTTDTYKALSAGKLSDAHITQRAKRYAVKLFISHVYEAMYYDKFHTKAPRAYVIEHMGHHDYIAPEVDYKEFIK